MPARAEHHFDPPLVQEMERPLNIIGAFDLVVDVLDAGPVGRKQRYRMMHGIDPQKRRVANTIGHTGVANLRPELFVSRCVGGAEPDMREPGDTGIAHAVISLGRLFRPDDQLDFVSRRITKGDESCDLAQRGFFRASVADFAADRLESGGRLFEFGLRGNFECHGLIARVAREIAKRVSPGVGFEVDGVLVPLRNFQTEIAGGESFRAFEVSRAHPDITDIA